MSGITEGVIVVCLIIIVFVLDRKFNNKFISSNASDWLILLWYKEFKDFDLDGKVKNIEILDNEINVEFVPIIGWKYNDTSHKYGYLTPITPPIYRVKDRISDSDKFVQRSYWIRDGKGYEISSEWTEHEDIWGELTNWIIDGKKIKFNSSIPDSLQNNIQDIYKKSEPYLNS
mgnify:CR=1 FL=1